jgi:serine/threonine protein kinase
MGRTRKQKTKRRARVRTRGGRRLGEGSFGFVVKPAIPCVGKDVTKKVSKVFKSLGELSEKRRSEYQPFSVLKKNLEPVIAKLHTIDPYRSTFLYPEFCDRFGDLTYELEVDGVTEENKQNSYLMNYGGVSYHSLFSNLFDLCNQIFTDKKKYIKKLQETLPGEPPDKWFSQEEYVTTIYNKIAPLVHKIELIILRLHEADVVHGDIHEGNILLDTEDKLLKNWSKYVLETLDKIKQSPGYKGWSAHGYTGFRGYPLDIYQALTILTALKELRTLDLLKFNARIIDWDHAIMLSDIEDPEERIDVQKEELSNLLEFILPIGGIFGSFREKYDRDYYKE